MQRDHTDHSQHLFPTTQEKTLHMDITRWSTPKSDWLYFLQPKVEKLYTVSKTRTRADCGSDHELLIAKFRLKLKKVGETTRPLRYDLNLIPYDYTVEVMNRLKRLDLVERVPEELWQRSVTLYRRQWPKPTQRKRTARRQRGWGLTNIWRKKRSEKQGRKGKIYPIEWRLHENSKEKGLL